jgi:tetratricopeptide (TPR) repeat protein
MCRYIPIVAAAFVVVAARGAAAQSLDDARKAFDAAQYQQVVDAAGSSRDPRMMFVVAQSLQKLHRQDDARHTYEQLGGEEPWPAVGRSAIALLASNAGGALQEADQAIARGPSIAEAHYLRGLALSAGDDQAAAAAAFEKAAELDPSWAYAHYYAGIAYSKVKRGDLTASHFQTFLKLAPQAPERGMVQSILRTLAR